MFKRNIKSRVEAALKRSPVVLLTGARQSGKTVLVESIAQEKNYNYFTMDDIPTYLSAKNDPVGFIANIEKPVVIDEVQRVPELFLAIKRDVDKNRVAGNYLLTGSTNPILIPQVADALTGRIETISLLPLSQGELLGIKEQFIDTIFSGKNPSNIPSIKESLSRDELYKKILIGGFPVMQNLNEKDRKVWINEYIKNIVQKDAQDIAQISEPADLYTLVYSMANRASGLLNIADISRTISVPQATLQRYSSLLEALYMIYLQRSWHMDSEKQFIKAKKAYLVDSGFLSNLLKLNMERAIEYSSLMGNVIENFVVMELLKQLGWSETEAELYHFRTTGNIEVDVVIQDEYKNIVGIEIKGSSTVSYNDFKGLEYLQNLTQDKFIKGIVLYLGDKVIPFGKNLIACPISILWNN